MPRLIAGWGTVVAFFAFGGDLLSKSNLDSWPVELLLFAWLLGVILWCAFGVVVEPDHLAEMLGEPLGTLILTLSIVVMMIVLNGVVGLSLVVGGLRHHTQDYSLPGASAYLVVIIPLATIALILPSVTQSTPDRR